MTGSPSIETQHGHPGIVLATLSLASVMALLDLFVVNVALHDIGAYPWADSGFVLVIAGVSERTAASARRHRSAAAA